jgi:hypothetical protein
MLKSEVYKTPQEDKTSDWCIYSQVSNLANSCCLDLTSLSFLPPRALTDVLRQWRRCVTALGGCGAKIVLRTVIFSDHFLLTVRFGVSPDPMIRGINVNAQFNLRLSCFAKEGHPVTCCCKGHEPLSIQIPWRGSVLEKNGRRPRYDYREHTTKCAI